MSLDNAPFFLARAASEASDLYDLLKHDLALMADLDGAKRTAFLQARQAQPEQGLCRVAFFAEDWPVLIDKIKTFCDKRSGWVLSDQPKTAFLMTGQGAQYVAMGRALRAAVPFFDETMSRVDQVFQSVIGTSLLDSIDDATQPEPINQTGITQPALYAIEYALACLWQHWGIKPDVVMGHSVGEFVAAQVAGVLSFEDGLTLIAARARLMQALPSGGGMLAVMSGLSDVEATLGDHFKTVDVAALNGPKQTVLSGALDALDAAAGHLKSSGVKSRALTVSHAFHSRLMDPMLAEFGAVAATLSYAAPQVALLSNVTGAFADASTYNADYWVNHVRGAVRFYPSMQTLTSTQSVTRCIEIGPQPVLIGMAKRCVSNPAAMTWLPSMKRDQEVHTFFESLQAAYTTVHVSAESAVS